MHLFKKTKKEKDFFISEHQLITKLYSFLSFGDNDDEFFNTGNSITELSIVEENDFFQILQLKDRVFNKSIFDIEIGEFLYLKTYDENLVIFRRRTETISDVYVLFKFEFKNEDSNKIYSEDFNAIPVHDMDGNEYYLKAYSFCEPNKEPYGILFDEYRRLIKNPSNPNESYIQTILPKIFTNIYPGLVDSFYSNPFLLLEIIDQLKELHQTIIFIPDEIVHFYDVIVYGTHIRREFDASSGLCSIKRP